MMLVKLQWFYWKMQWLRWFLIESLALKTVIVVNKSDSLIEGGQSILDKNYFWIYYILISEIKIDFVVWSAALI